MKRRAIKQRFEFSGDLKDDDILIGSYGDAVVNIEGTFDLAGTIYCPKYSVTLFIKGNGKATFRGKCDRVIIKRMEGNCILDLSELTSKELQCISIKGQSRIITGKTRLISQANLSDEAVLELGRNPLVTKSSISGKSRIVPHGTEVLT